jgi:hypothetical protein
VGGRRGRETRRRARVHTRRSTTRVGRAELIGQAHSAEKEKGTCGATARQLVNRAREAEREEGHAGEETGTDRSAPLGSERERGECVGERAAADRRGPPVRRRGRAAARPGGAGWATFPFSFSLDFLIPFLFLFYRVFKSKFKLGFNFK